MTPKNQTVTTTPTLTPHELAALGGGRIAYVRAMRGEELTRLFPQAPSVAADQQIYVLLAADGSPLVIADTEQAAVANAWSHDLVPLSLH